MTEPSTPSSAPSSGPQPVLVDGSPGPVMPGRAVAPAGPRSPWAQPPPFVPAPPGPVTRALTEFWGTDRPAASTRVLVACGVVGVAGAGLLVGHRPGLGLAVVGLLLWVAAAPTLVRRRAYGDLATAGMSVALVGVVAVRDAGWVVALCLLAAVLAASAAATSARSVPAVLLSPLSGAAGLVRALPWVSRGVGRLVGSRRGHVRAVLRSAALTGGLLLVFGLLFASADKVFASYVPRLDLARLPGQVIVGALVAIAAAAVADLVRTPPTWSTATLPAGRPAGRGEWLVPVVSLDLLVLAFVLVQVGALLGGHEYVEETAGLQYAEYARQGFAQLVAVTCLTLVVVAVAARRAPRETVRDRLVSRVALGVLCIGTLGVVASALRRMDLYVEAFGLTRLRIVAVVIELVLAAVLVLLVVAGVRWRASWLPRSVVQVAAVAVLALALVNPDAMIVRHNTTADLLVTLDIGYLQGLSADAVPAIDELAEPLRSCLLDDVTVDAPEGLADWNLSRDAAAQTIASGAPVESIDGSACATAARDSR